MLKQLKKFCYTVCIILPVIVLASCGGGGSSGSNGGTSGPSNDNPVYDAPTVKSITPSNGATNVPTNTLIQVQFSESVSNVVANSTVILHVGSAKGGAVTIAPYGTVTNNTYQFDVKTTLSKSTDYYIELTSGIKSVAHGTALADSVFKFTTGADNSPEVSMSEPANNATNVSPTQAISLHFSVPVVNVTESTVTIHEGSPTSTTTVPVTTIDNLDNTNTDFVVSHDDLKTNTKYFVVLSNGIVSQADGLPLTGDSSFSFTTGNVVAPTVSILSPADGTDVAKLKPVIRLRFSNQVTNVEQGVTLVNSTDNSTVALTPFTAESGNVYSFSPVNNLNTYTTYTVEVSNKVVSVAGNVPVVPASFEFTVTGPKLAYITTPNVGITVCKVSNTGSFESKTDDCQLAKQESSAYRVIVNPSHTLAYIVRKSKGDVKVCQISRADGLISNCVVTGNGFNQPSNVTFALNGTYALVTNAGGKNVSTCSVSESGLLAACTTSGSNLNNPDSLAIDETNTFAYITNNGNSTVTQCAIESTTATLSSCYTTGSNFTHPQGLAFGQLGSGLYVTSEDRITGCSVGATTGTLSCNYASNREFTRLADVAIDGSSIYVADNGNGAISLCHQDKAGSLLACRFVSYNNVKVTGFTLLNN